MAELLAATPRGAPALAVDGQLAALAAAGRAQPATGPELQFFERQCEPRDPADAGGHSGGGSDSARGRRLNFEEVLFVTAGNRGLEELGDLPRCVNAEFVWVGGNALRSLAPVAPLAHLRLFDASCNALHALPREDFFAGLPHLSVLFLHGNNIAKVAPRAPPARPRAPPADARPARAGR